MSISVDIIPETMESAGMPQGRTADSPDGQRKKQKGLQVTPEMFERIDAFLAKYKTRNGLVRSGNNLFEAALGFYMEKVEEAHGKTLEEKCDGRGFPKPPSQQRGSPGRKTGTEE